MLKVWNLSLIVGTYALTTFGTFLTRGSILSSVHAFAQSIVGPMYLGFLVLVLLGGFGLIALQSWRLRSEGRLDSALSRESAFLANNVVLLVVTFVVLLGTIFPLVVEALTDRQASVGEPYFRQATAPLLLLLLFLMGIGPLLPWRRATPEQLRRRATIPVAAGAATIGILALTGIRSVAAAAALGMAAFVATTNGLEIARGIRTGVVMRNRRRYGGYLVHVGVAVAAVAITVSSSFGRQAEFTLAAGERASFAGYELRYGGRREVTEPHRMVLVADVSVGRDGRSLGRMTPSLNLYPGASEPIGTPSVRYGVLRDLYASVIGFDGEGEDERATFRFFLNPGVTWLWVGGSIMAMGGLLAAWPGRRRATSSVVKRGSSGAEIREPVQPEEVRTR